MVGMGMPWKRAVRAARFEGTASPGEVLLSRWWWWCGAVVLVVIKRNMCYLLAESADYHKMSFWIVECVFPIYCSKVQCIAWDVNHRCRTSCNYSVHFRDMVVRKTVMIWSMLPTLLERTSGVSLTSWLRSHSTFGTSPLANRSCPCKRGAWSRCQRQGWCWW